MTDHPTMPRDLSAARYEALLNPQTSFDPKAKPFRILDCMKSLIVCLAIVIPTAILWSQTNVG